MRLINGFPKKPKHGRKGAGMPTIEEIRQALPDFIPLIDGLIRQTKEEMAGPCPKCGGKDRFRVWPETKKFWCRQCGWKGDAVDFFAWKHSTDMKGLVAMYGPFNGNGSHARPEEKKTTKREKAAAVERNIVAYFDYHDEESRILSYAVRFEEAGKDKDFRQWQKGADGEWIYHINGVRRVLYNLPEVLKADVVYLVEGEKCVEAMRAIGLTATTSPMGAKNWRDEYAESLRGKTVFILPDNDAVGNEYGLKAAASLHGIAKQIRIVTLPDLPEKGDVFDFIQRFPDPTEAAGAIIDLADAAPIWEPGPEPEASEAKEKKTSPFKLVRVGDLTIKPVTFLVKGLLEAACLALIFGDPGTFKSFLAIAWACCVATGTAFMGRAVKQGPVIYVAGEGQNGLARRFRAWAIRNQRPLDKAPLFVSLMPAGLCDAEQARFVADAIDEITKEHGAPVLIVIDTLARNFGPGDENSTKDMTGFIASCDLIRTKYQSTVLLVHHSGHSDKSRARGAIALKGALDAEYRTDIDDAGVIRFEATKMKDAEFPEPMAFRAAVVELGQLDEDGNPVTSCVLDETAYEPPATSGKAGRGKWQTVAVEVLENLFQSHRQRLLEKDFNPETARVSVEDWRKACVVAGLTSRTTYKRVKETLSDLGTIKIESGFVELI